MKLNLQGYTMITKHIRPGQSGNPYYKDGTLMDLHIVDRNGQGFLMTVGGNLDMYWIPDKIEGRDRHDTSPITYEFDKSDELLFDTFNDIFSAIERVDNPQSPSIRDGVFSFISEDYPEEDANILKMRRDRDKICIDFVQTAGESPWGKFKSNSNICFCNSGSRVPRIEQIFMLKFNELAYQNPEIELTK